MKNENNTTEELQAKLAQLRLRVAELEAAEARRSLIKSSAGKDNDFSQMVLNSLTAHLAVLDEKGHIIAVNRAWQQFAADNGAGDSPQVSVGVSYLDVCRAATGPDAGEAQQALAGIEQVLAGEMEEFELEYPCHSPNEQRWFLMRASRLDSPAGGGVIAHLNVTDRKLVEENLRDNERLIEQITATAPTLLYVFDLTKKQNVYINSHVSEFFGLTLTELQEGGLALFAELLHPDDQSKLDEFLEQWDQAQDGQIFEIAYRMRDFSGQYRWLRSRETVLNRTPDGAVRQILGVAVDITPHKEADEALRQSEERHRIISELTSDYVYAGHILPDGRAVTEWVSGAFEQITGYTLEEYNNRGGWPAIVHPDDLGWLFEFAKDIPATETFVLEYRIVTKDGQVRWLYDNLRVEVDEAHPGQLRYYGGTHDITARKEAETQLRAALEEKEILLRELYHRTKNNMQVIQSTLALRSTMIEDETAQNVFKEMEGRITSMALVHQMLYQSGNLSSIDLKEYVGDLARVLIESHKVKPAGILLTLELDSVLVLIDTAIPCGLIINELVSNSLKHAFPQGSAGEIRIKLVEHEGIIRLIYADNGIGLPPEFEMDQPNSLGFQTVFGLGQYQLQGKVSFETGPGLTWHIEFRDNLYKPRV